MLDWSALVFALVARPPLHSQGSAPPSGMRGVPPALMMPPAASARVHQQELFRHRLYVCPDMLIRLPIEATSEMRALVSDGMDEANAIDPDDDGARCIHTHLEAFRPRETVRWSPDAQRMLLAPNGGGSSVLSEALSFEMLARAFGAQLQKTEMELAYHGNSKITGEALARADQLPSCANA